MELIAKNGSQLMGYAMNTCRMFIEKLQAMNQRSEVERFCQHADIRWTWKADGTLRTTQHCQAIEVHPVTGDTVWFNQAHLFHSSNLQPEVRESLEDLLGAENLPRNTFFADGSEIPDALFDEIRAVLEAPGGRRSPRNRLSAMPASVRLTRRSSRGW